MFWRVVALSASCLLPAGGTCPSNVVLPPANFTVAIAADVYLDFMPGVLRMFASRKPDVVIVNGDVGYYDCDPQAPSHFMHMVRQALGSSTPLFLTKGNHDEYGHNWEPMNGYADLLAQRWQSAGNLNDFACRGGWGINQTCRHKGVAFNFATHGCESCLGGQVQCGTSQGYQRACDSTCQAFPGFHTRAFENSSSLWRLCLWHKNMHNLQLGGKLDETGFGPYEECLRAGAMVFNGHEHSYARTRNLINMTRQTVDPAWSRADPLRVKEGSSFVVVGALGGYNKRPQLRCLPTTHPYGCNGEWGKILSGSHTETASVGATALILRFNVDGNPCKARIQLVSDQDEVLDEFEVYSQVALSEHCCPASPSVTSSTSSALFSSTKISSTSVGTTSAKTAQTGHTNALRLSHGLVQVSILFRLLSQLY